MNIPFAIRQALECSVDYSKDFSERVEVIGRALSLALGKTVKHDADMSYRAGQHLSFEAAASQRNNGRSRASAEIRVYISSKGRLFSIYSSDFKVSRDRDADKFCMIDPSGSREYSRDDFSVCRGVLVGFGYFEVSCALFNKPAPGCLTEMDELPATIFEALFAEVV